MPLKEDQIVTVLMLKKFAANIARVVQQQGSEPTSARIAVLESRIAALEERAPLSYGGTWSPGQQSNKGIFYTDKGSVWYCRETTRDRPGTSDDFMLAVKKGRDAR